MSTKDITEHDYAYLHAAYTKLKEEYDTLLDKLILTRKRQVEAIGILEGLVSINIVEETDK